MRILPLTFMSLSVFCFMSLAGFAAAKAEDQPVAQSGVSAAAEGFEDIWGAMWEKFRYEAGQFAGPANVSVLHEDITCDGVKDYVGGYVNDINPDMDSFLIVIAAREGDEIVQTSLTLPFDDGTEYALTANEEYGIFPPQITLHAMDEEHVAEFGFPVPVCNLSLRIDDGMTGSIYAFWVTEPDADGARLALFRN
ncbi:MAG: hypothetical protein EA357_05670 [Micavibrio sp.]|nr:MAG: hypothetical protein EA357_05670 [Micavibrio sp.]